MKRILNFLMLGAIVAFASCQKDNTSGNGSEGDEIQVSISANLPGELLTKSHGDGVVSRYIMEVYNADGSLYKRVSQATSKFDMRMIAGRTYDFVFWADKQTDISEPYYTTNTSEGLKKVTMVAPYAGNKEERDAFFGKTSITFNSSVNPAISVELRRPFAQLNVITGDKDIPTKYKPKFVKMTYNSGVYSAFNAFDGVVVGEPNTDPIVWSGLADITAASPYAGLVVGYYALATDYLFAAPATGSTVEFKMEFYADSNESSKVTERTFSNIPVQRNFRTNITGQLLTTDNNFTVTVDPVFGNPDNNIFIIDDASMSISQLIAQAFAKMAANGVEGGSVVFDINYAIKEGDINQVINILDAVAGLSLSNITLNFLGGITASTLTITDENPADHSSNYTGTVKISVNGHLENLVVNLSAGSFSLGSGSYSNIHATTSGNTFVVEKGVTVPNMTIKGGRISVLGCVVNLYKNNAELINVEGEGKIENLFINNNNGITLPFIASVEKLANIELTSTGNIVVNSAPYAGFVKVNPTPTHILVKSGYVIYEGAKYSPNYINDLTNKWYGYGIDLGVNLEVIGIPKYLGMCFLGAKAQLDFGGDGFTAKKLTEVKFTANGASAALPINLQNLTSQQEIQAKVDAMVAQAIAKLPKEAEIRTLFNKYIAIVPASKKAEVTKAFDDAIALIYSKLGTNISLPNPTITGVTIPTYFKSSDNLSSAKIEQINNGLKLILDIVNGVVDSEAALESVKLEIAALEADIKALDATIANLDAQIALIDGPAVTAQKRIAAILGAHSLLVKPLWGTDGNVQKRATAVAELDALGYRYNQGISRNELLDLSADKLLKLAGAVTAQGVIVADMELNGSPESKELKAQRNKASGDKLSKQGTLLLKKGEELARQELVKLANQQLEGLGLPIDIETLAQIIEPMISVLDLSIQFIKPIEQFVDSINPWVYSGSIKSNEVITSFKVNLKLGDVVEVEKTK